MKKAEEYLKKANDFYRCNIRMEDVLVNEEAALKAIKAAQIDAIEAAVLKCAETIDEASFLCTKALFIAKITQVAEELKKELE